MNFGSWRFWIWPIAIVAVIGINMVIWVPRFVTSGPSFCLSCHGQGDTPDISNASLVHPSFSKVGCTQCHATPEKHMVVTDLYREGVQASAERVSENCVRCHDDVLDKDPSQMEFNELKIDIPHRVHVETVGVLCGDCHRNIAHDFNEEPTNRPRMEYCTSCHDQERKSDTCMTCHSQGLPSAPVRPGATLVHLVTPPEVPHSLAGRQGTCLVCHKDGIGGAPGVPGFHVSNGFASDQCLSCHRAGAVASPAPTSGAGPATAPGTTPGEAPAVTAVPAGGPPGIPHSLEGRDNCVICHGEGGFKPFPADHKGRTNDTCRACHTATTT